MSVIITCAREWIRGFALPLASIIGENVGIEDIYGVTRRFKELIGEDLARKLDAAFEDVLKDEIRKALNTDRLEQELHLLVERFWAKIAYPLVELTQSILFRGDRAALDEFITLEEKLSVNMAKLIRESNYKFAENLVYGLSVLVDHDKWVIEKISKLGINGFIERTINRDPKALMEFASYIRYLIFAWLATTATVLGVTKEYKEENRDKMAQWCREYAKEVEAYIDTLDIIVKDEVYGELIELGIIKR